MKVAMISLGCPKNQIDAEIMLAALQKDGFTLTPDVSGCDAVLINTCGFIQSAKEEAIHEILEMAELKKEGRLKAIIVTGCMAERYREDIAAELPEVDAVVGIGSNAQICDIVKNVLGNADAAADRKTRIFAGPKEALPLSGDRLLTTLPYYAYLKIAEGCDNCCSYCAIPQIRGRFRSRPMEEIIAEARGLSQSGVRELILVAQDTTRYGQDLYGEYRLAELLRRLCEIDGLRWIRTLYCYPDKITEELLDVLAQEEKLVHYLDIPIQHCNGEILRAMNRPQNRKELTALFRHIREKVPDITLRTTLITGFPGETHEQFLELADFVDTVRFDRLGCFCYSAEEGTPAARREDQVDEDVKARREEIIMRVQAVRMERANRRKVGKTLEVLVEGFDKYAECYYGRTRADAPEIDGKVFFTTEEHPVMGDFVQVRITDVMDYDLVGEQE